MSKTGPSLALQLAQALCSESKDTLRDVASKREILELWQRTAPAARRFWIRKARRVLARWRPMGPQ